MKNIDPRIEKVLRYQHLAIIINLIVSLAFAYFVATSFFENPWVGALAGVVASSLLIRLLNWASLIILQFIYYRFDVDELLADAMYAQHVIEKSGETKSPMREIAFKIIGTPDKHVGTFMGEQFFEWLDVEHDDGQLARLVFKGTADISQGYPELETGLVILPPGLIYQVDTSINSST